MTNPRSGFTSSSGREAGRKSGEARRARKLHHEQSTRDARAVAQSVNADHLGPLARIATADLIDRVIRREVPVRNAADAATLVKELHAVERLEAGQATSITVNAGLSAEGIAAAAQQLRQRVLEAQGAAQLERGETPDSSAIEARERTEPRDTPSLPTGPVVDGPGDGVLEA